MEYYVSIEEGELVIAAVDSNGVAHVKGANGGDFKTPELEIDFLDKVSKEILDILVECKFPDYYDEK
jgi:hypothetical protein